MNVEILIAGFGGQGVLSMGKMLAYAAMTKGLEVCWMPSYGPEMRGGTANVTVIVGDERINSPILSTFDIVVVLNQQSLNKFESSVKEGGSLFYDSNGLLSLPKRKDINIFHIPAYVEATKMQNIKIFNMIVLGALIKKIPSLDPQYMKIALEKTLPKRSHSMIPLNMDAFHKGEEILEDIQIL
jgi:2-oxoglutarate ferredoxin oxidoreductase subunit gamma